MDEKNTKKYLLLALVQVVVLALYSVGNYFALKVEMIVLNPLVYLIPFGILLLAADIVCVILIFRNKAKAPSEKKEAVKFEVPSAQSPAFGTEGMAYANAQQSANGANSQNYSNVQQPAYGANSQNYSNVQQLAYGANSQNYAKAQQSANGANSQNYAKSQRSANGANSQNYAKAQQSANGANSQNYANAQQSANGANSQNYTNAQQSVQPSGSNTVSGDNLKTADVEAEVKEIPMQMSDAVTSNIAEDMDEVK